MAIRDGAIPTASLPASSFPSYSIPGSEFTLVLDGLEEIKRNDLMELAMMALQAGLLD